MKLRDLYHEALLWTCYLENYSEPERFLNLYGLTIDDRIVFDRLGKFFPFDEFYMRGADLDVQRAISDMRLSKKHLILPWIYRPMGVRDTIYGKDIICPSAELFDLLDNKIEAKKLFWILGLSTPPWGFSNKGTVMVEKPIRNSAGGININITNDNPREGYFLEYYIPDCRSIGLQFFVHGEAELVCADEMIYCSGEMASFIFRAQRNVRSEDLPPSLLRDCFDLLEYLAGIGYRGFIGIDALVRGSEHYLIEINPRGIAFLPAFFAASSLGWTSFVTCMKEGAPDSGEFVLLDFGRLKKVVRKE